MITYFRQHHDEIISWLGNHVWLSALPVLLGLIIALPLGWLANRYRWLYAPLISVAGLLGTKVLDPINVAVALTIYTVALLVRVVADGLASVPEDVAQAATAMGYKRFQRLVAVELPIAVPVIAAGLRVAAVSNVSLVAVAATIGVPELGQLFTNGFQLSYFAPILIGILLCVALALVFDTVIVLTTRALTPWRRAVQPS